MAINCSDITTLVHTYLDGELADQDLEEFEEHVLLCGECHARLEDEISFRDRLRRDLAPPRAPADLHQRIGVLLDQEDRVAQAARRQSRFAWLLPGAASVAAAAALVLFITSTGQNLPVESVATDAVKAHMRRPPIEIQGQDAMVSPWIAQHFRPGVEVPRFSASNVSLRGARLSSLRGREAAQLFYEVDRNHQRHDLQVHIVEAKDLDLGVRHHQVIGGREVWIDDQLGYSVVTLKDDRGMGYVFTSDMDGKELFDLVLGTDLVLGVGERPNR